MPTLIQSIFSQRCPRCRKGRLFLHSNPYRFKDLEKMPKECPVCGQDYVIEPGFFFGATYVSYALNVAWMVPLFLLIRFFLGYSFQTFVIVFIAMLPLLIPILFRWSRSAWIHMFVKYDPAIAAQVRQQS